VGEWLPKVEQEMRTVLDNDEAAVDTHYGMMRYSLGWANEQLEPAIAPAGKRIRPILCLLACSEVGGNVEQALPAAASIELVHNFSLIHDDIEDGDEVRRHRPTVWKLWGDAQAINAGDGMFALAFDAMQRLDDMGVHPGTTLRALRLITRACVEVTEGQHLDIGFEQRGNVTVAEYQRMVRGKTASLLAASVGIGAIVGGASVEQVEALWRFGLEVGLAFQAQDDVLGIWGDPALTGKAVGNDILRRKKSLPLLHGLNHSLVGGRLRAVFDAEDFGPDDLVTALSLLEEARSRRFAEVQVRLHHDRAVTELQAALGNQASESALLALAESLIQRQV
jgi:geranylgeranyl diphosphate synthase type I